MQIAAFAKPFDFAVVAALVGAVAHVQGLVEVAHEVREHFYRHDFVFSLGIAARFNLLNELGDRFNYIAFCGVVAGFIGQTVWNSAVMPRIHVVVGPVGLDVVHPVGAHGQRLVAQNALHGSGSFRMEVVFCNLAHHTVARLAPTKELSGEKKEDERHSAEKRHF